MANKVETVPGGTPPVASSKQRITSLSSSTGLTPPDSASWALIQPLTQNVRWWDDGSTPTASQGHQLLVGAYLEYTGDLKAVRFIEETGSAVLNVTYYTNNPRG